jgi:acyl-CoA synthetase (AMP-forming)/AMP-acid ligase II
MRQIDFFDQGVVIAPEARCLVGPDLTFSFRQAHALSCRVANGLRAADIASAAVLSANDVMGFACILGIFRAETLSLALNARAALKDNAEHLRLGNGELLFYHSDFEAEAQRLRELTPSLKFCVCIDRAGALGPSLSDWIADQSESPPEWLPDDRDRTYRITLTGGTTGTPKGVMHAHLQAEVNTAAFLASFHYSDIQPRYLLAAPMTHAAGLVSFHVLALGGSVHFMSKVDPLSMLQTIERERITTTVLPPTVLYGLLAHPQVREFNFTSLRYLLIGTAPLSAEKLREAVEVFGPVLGQLYGQSECPMATYLSPQVVAEAVANSEHAGRLLSCGRPLPLTLMAIMDDDGRLLPDGERGEIVMRSNQVMRGFVDNPGATADCSAFGWHHTSDIGYRDADGFYYIVDRKRDLIISGGFNVYPSEVEQVIWSHPAVQDCAVIGVPDERWGEAVKAVVLLKPGVQVNEEDLIALCKSRVGSLKAPKTVEFWPELPRSAVGKVLKRSIRERYWAGIDRKI